MHGIEKGGDGNGRQEKGENQPAGQKIVLRLAEPKINGAHGSLQHLITDGARKLHPGIMGQRLAGLHRDIPGAAALEFQERNQKAGAHQEPGQAGENKI